MITKVALYVRVSTDEQAKEGYSIEAQKNFLLKYCDLKGYEVVDLYVDDGYSAKSLDRPEMQRLLRNIARSEMELVIFYKLDRFTRSVRDLQWLITHFQTHKIRFASATEEYNTDTAQGKLILNMSISIAEWERETIGERVKFAMGQKASEGKRNGGRTPFGYRYENGLVVELIEADIVRKIFNQYVYENMGSLKIAAQLNRLGVPYRNKPWNRNTITRILKNDTYCGKNTWMDITRIGDHEPIISEELFEITQSLIAKRTLTKRAATSDYLFSGVIRCGRCKERLVGAQAFTNTKQGGKYSIYRCTGHRNKGICDLPYLSEKNIANAFLEQLIFNLDDVLFDQLTFEKEEEDHTQLRDSLVKELEKIKEARKSWQMAFREKVISLDDLKERLEEEDKREHYLQEQLSSLPDQEYKTQLSKEEKIEVIRSIKDYLEHWQRASLVQQKRFIQEYFKEVVIDAIPPRKRYGYEINVLSITLNY